MEIGLFAIIVAIVGVVAGLFQIFDITVPDLIVRLRSKSQKIATEKKLSSAKDAISKGHYHEAIETLQNLAVSSPENMMVHALLGIAEAGHQSFTKAQTAFATAIALGDTRISTRLNYTNVMSYLNGEYKSNYMIMRDNEDLEISIDLNISQISINHKDIELLQPPAERIDVPAMQPPLTHFGVVSNVQINDTFIKEYLSIQNIQLLAEKGKNIILDRKQTQEDFIIFSIEDPSLTISGNSCDWIIAHTIGKLLEPICLGVHILKNHEVTKWLRKNSDYPLVYCGFSARYLPTLYDLLSDFKGDVRILVILSVLGPDLQTRTKHFSNPPLYSLFPLDKISLAPLGEICH